MGRGGRESEGIFLQMWNNNDGKFPNRDLCHEQMLFLMSKSY